MGLSVDSKVKELMANPAALEVLEKYSPGVSTNKQMKMVGALSYRKLASYPQANLTPEQVEEIDKELRALGD